MIQVARGYFYENHITPTLEHIDSEWHVECYEGDIGFQSIPYVCMNCIRQIRHGEFVSYVTVGTAPETSYIRPENRGYEMAHIEHVRCRLSR